MRPNPRPELVISTVLLLLVCRSLLAGSDSIGTVQIVTGTGEVLRGGGVTVALSPAARTAGVEIGDTIVTHAGSEAIVRAGKSIYNLRAGAQLKLESPSADQGLQVSEVSLFAGFATFFIPSAPGAKSTRFTVRAGSVNAAVKGTVFQVDRTRTSTTSAAIAVLKGKVQIDRVIDSATTENRSKHRESKGFGSVKKEEADPDLVPPLVVAEAGFRYDVPADWDAAGPASLGVASPMALAARQGPASPAGAGRMPMGPPPPDTLPTNQISSAGESHASGSRLADAEVTPAPSRSSEAERSNVPPAASSDQGVPTAPSSDQGASTDKSSKPVPERSRIRVEEALGKAEADVKKALGERAVDFGCYY